MNSVFLDGRLTGDPETMTTQSGLTITSFNLANNTGYGEKKKTNFFKCKTFGKTAEATQKFAKKGMEVIIEAGEISLSSYEGKDGVKKYSTEILVNKIKFIFTDKKPEGQSDQGIENNPFDDNLIPF